MTPEQRKRVAELATNKEWIVCTFGPNGGGLAYVADKRDPCKEHLWKPDFNGQDWQRSQALAVVEWIADRLTNPEKFKPVEFLSDYYFDFVRKFAAKDIDSLLSLVLELSDEM